MQHTIDLPQSKIDFFNEYGYVVVENIISQEDEQQVWRLKTNCFTPSTF